MKFCHKLFFIDSYVNTTFDQQQNIFLLPKVLDLYKLSGAFIY